MPKIDYKKTDVGTKWAIACNPVTQEYHNPVEISQGKRMSSGWPVIVYGDSPDDVCQRVFTSYTLDADNHLTAYNPRNLKISVGYDSESEAQATVDDAHVEIDGLTTCPIKHPSRNEWAVVYQEHIFTNHGLGGERRNSLINKAQQQAASGNHKTPSTARSQGWR